VIVCHWQKQIPALLVSDQAVLHGLCGSVKIASGQVLSALQPYICVFNRRKSEKLRSADADVAGIGLTSGLTSDNSTKRTTSVSNYTFI